jgi:hypothetical protein
MPMPSHAQARVSVDAFTVVDSGDHPPPDATGSTDRGDPHGKADRRRACEALIAAYRGDTHRLLTDLADHLGASVAYVDRPTIEAHLERPLSAIEWSACASRFTAMAFDDHVGDAGTIRTAWIEDVLLRAGVPGRGQAINHRSNPARPPIRR